MKLLWAILDHFRWAMKCLQQARMDVPSFGVTMTNIEMASFSLRLVGVHIIHIH